jgi:hypothetical protein
MRIRPFLTRRADEDLMDADADKDLVAVDTDKALPNTARG